MTNNQKVDDSARSANDFSAMAKIFRWLCIVVAIAIPFASFSSHGAVWINAIGLSFSVFLAAALSGGLIGFIFSVPYVNKVTKVVESDGDKAAADGATTTAVLEQRQPLLRSNSNLEKISEWLTTMLVGVGLSQINYIFEGLKKFGEFFAPMDTMKIDGVDVVVAHMKYAGPVVLVAGLTIGFLGVYLYTRLRISYLFHHVEREFNSDNGANATLTVEESKTLTSIAEKSALKESPGLKVMASTNRTSVRDALSVMTQLLYDVKGKGFLQAIEMGNELISTPAVSVPRFWFLMAAAHGQNYTNQKAAGAPDDVLKKIREDVLYSIDKTLELNPKYKPTFLNMLNKKSVDNDLKSFADDPDFSSRLR
ncbi:hypothetical protein [Rhizobium sp. LjRoot254]|uniref:hypothetical protein n=1 Tax=Rhizobium sp. LjRoot254 TaxID=3342297 RepID=UPI003ECEEB32